MDSNSSSASSTPAFRSPAPFKHTLQTPQQRYKQQQQLLRDQMMTDKKAAVAERVQRDRMSRGKDPYCSDESEVESEQVVGSSPARGYRIRA